MIMNLESFTALDEQVTKEDWEQTPASVRQLLRWLFENYEERLADLEEEKALSKVEAEAIVETGSTDISTETAKHKELRCSFCGKKRNEVVKLIWGANACICNECVEVCDVILEDDAR